MLYPSLSRAAEGFLLNTSAAGRSPYPIRNYKTELNRFSHLVGLKDVFPHESHHSISIKFLCNGGNLF
jgi:hypothetical protein